MPIHPAYLIRFHLLDGITSFAEVASDPALEERLHEFMQHRDAAPPPDVLTRDTSVPGPHGPVPVRIYEPTGSGPRPCLVWHHGGAFMMGDLDMPEADRTAREVCAAGDAVVISVDYRLALGGVHYPVPLDDCVAVVRWARDRADELGVDPEQIFVGGASAGANLATGAALRLRDEDQWQPAGLIAVYGVFHPVLPPASDSLRRLMVEVPTALHFPAHQVAGITANYLGGTVSSADGYAMPALAVLEGLCPTTILNAEYDDLRSSGEAFTGALAAAGVDVQQFRIRGALHGFLNLPADVEPVGEAFELIARIVSGRHTSLSPSPEPVPS